LKRWNKRKGSLVYQFTSWYVLCFVTVLILIGLAVLASVIFFLHQTTQKELQAMDHKLKEAVRDDKGELKESLNEILYPDYANYFVRISKGDRVLAQTKEWSDTIEDEETSQLLWFKSYIWNHEEGLFYKKDINWKEDSEEGTILIRIQLEEKMEFLELIFQTLLYIGIISLLVGSILIYRLAKRSLKPLLLITDSVGEMGGEGDLSKRIPEPEKPRELADLSTTFNHLLDKLEMQFEKEKSFVSNASHELRTPLTSFRGHLNLIKRWGKDDPEILQQSIKALDQESERMQNIMEQMLFLARNEQQDGRREKVHLSSVLENVMEQFSVEEDKELINDIEQNVYVIGDQEQIRQIAIILIENAIHYTEEGLITVELKKSAKDALFRVKDTGIGIPEDEQNKVFDRFYRIDKNRSRKTGGTGLGLSIAKELVENQNGNIQLESEVGSGSIFTITLPIANSNGLGI